MLAEFGFASTILFLARFPLQILLQLHPPSPFTELPSQQHRSLQKYDRKIQIKKNQGRSTEYHQHVLKVNPSLPVGPPHLLDPHHRTQIHRRMRRRYINSTISSLSSRTRYNTNYSQAPNPLKTARSNTALTVMTGVTS